MSTLIALTLTAQLFNSCSGQPMNFQSMLDSAQQVVIAKVDSIWYSIDTLYAQIDGEQHRSIVLLTNVSCEVITLYTRNDSLPEPGRSVHIVYQGGEYPDGEFLYIPGSPSFEIGEVFLAALIKRPLQKSETPPFLYNVRSLWKYTISNDLVYLKTQAPISLGEALMALSSHFTLINK